MRMIRSFITASIAMAAMCLLASVPASAAVPIDPGIAVTMAAGKSYPAPAVTVVETAAQVGVIQMREDSAGGRSSIDASAITFASILGANHSLTSHAPPDLRMRC